MFSTHIKRISRISLTTKILFVVIFGSLCFLLRQSFKNQTTHPERFVLYERNEVANQQEEDFIYVTTELSYYPERNWPRFLEVIDAIKWSHHYNPRFYYVFVTSVPDMASLKPYLSDVPFDIYYTSEVVYSSPIEIGSKYHGIKITASVDDIFGPINWKCNFTEKVVFVISRTENQQLDGSTRRCDEMVGSFEGMVWKHTFPPEAIMSAKFSRSYYGCENVWAWIMEHHGFKIFQMCPFYQIYHKHLYGDRGDRIRVAWQHNYKNIEFTDEVKAYCTFTPLHPILPEIIPPTAQV